MTDNGKIRVSIQGFTKDATSLVREAEELGWLFRQANHGVVGQAPDGRTTMSIGRKSATRNRAFQNARGTLDRWKREQEGEARDMDTDAATARATILSSKPWRSSSRVNERRWSDGRTDYVCTYPGCGYTAFKSRTVSGHYGNAHTPWKMQEPSDTRPPKPVLVDPHLTMPVEEEFSETLVEDAVEEPVTDPGDGVMAETPEEVVLGDALVAAMKEFLAKVVPLVAGPLVVETERMRLRITELEQERDNAVQRMAKMKHDVKALSGLLDEIDG